MPNTSTSRWPIAMALAVGVIITSGLCFISWLEVSKKNNKEFEANSTAIATLVTQKLNTINEVISNLVTLFNSSLYVDNDQFRLYTNELLRRHKYIKTIYYLPVVQIQERQVYEQAMHDDGFVNHTIFTLNNSREDSPINRQYLPIRYIEPFSIKSSQLLGFDFLSNTDYEHAIRLATDSMRAVASSPGTAFESADEYHIFKVIFAGKDMPESISDRRTMRNGVVAMRVSVTDLLAGTGEFQSMDVVLEYTIASGNKIKKFQTTNAGGPAKKLTRLEYSTSLDFGGQYFTLNVVKSIDWRNEGGYIILAAFFLGLVLTGSLLAIAKISMLRSRELYLKHQEVQALVIERTGELAREKSALEKEMQIRRSAEVKMAKLSHALENAGDAVFITNRDGIIEYVNPAFEQITGFYASDVIGKLPNILKSNRHDNSFYGEMWSTVCRGETYRGTVVNRKKNGDIFYEEKTISPLKSDTGLIVNFVSTGKDVSKQVAAQERLEYMAHHDVLTNIANRTLFTSRLEHALKLADRRNESPTVIFIDLDGFKFINDTLGHDAGDMLIKIAAKRFNSCIRKSDTVARMGGDEFTILLEGLKQKESAIPVIQKILNKLNTPFEISGHELYVTGSIGVAVYPDDGNDCTTLMKNADAAMYHAKKNGKNNYQFYSNDMTGKDLNQLTLEANLRRALDREEFVLHYQPQVDVQSGRIVAMEALLRWNRPDHGLVPPNQFVPILEETGLITDVGNWVLETACKQNIAWQEAGFDPFRIAVNLSGRQFKHPFFVSKIAGVLAASKLEPSWLDLEITETTLMDSYSETAKKIAEIGALGVRISIDDFGTGYSSLSYLKKFPIDVLKIDRSFIRDVTTDADSAAIAKTIINMSHSLKLGVVAEGVENDDQLAFLKEHGCDVAQGFLFSKPVDTASTTILLNQTKQKQQDAKSATVLLLPRQSR